MQRNLSQYHSLNLTPLHIGYITVTTLSITYAPTPFDQDSFVWMTTTGSDLTTKDLDLVVALVAVNVLAGINGPRRRASCQ